MFVAECSTGPNGSTCTGSPSMGPQHVRCGMVARGPASPSPGSPFNGAATCSLRNDEQPGVPGCAPPEPSMGPQHVRCGMMSERGAHVRDGLPSMGPQHVRCGMCACPGRGRWRAASFNGAATCSLRNARKKLVLPDDALDLQWGRNMFVAECMSDARPAASSTFLQWGRNMFVAE